MMPVINGMLLAVGGSLAASIIVKATAAAAFGLIATALARRNRAAVRHALLAATFGVLLALPLASMFAPPVSIAVRIAPQGRPVSPQGGGVLSSPATRTDARVVAASANSANPPVAGLSSSDLLRAGWLMGAILFLLPMGLGLRQVRALRRSGLPWRHGQSIVETLAREAGIRRRVEVMLHEDLPGPMTCGVPRPAIVLPLDAQRWEPAELNRAIVHELEHVRRGDWISHCIARAICAVYWFHPLVWILWRQLALEAERSCDDAVLGSSEATAYADQLVGLATRLSAVGKSPALAMASRADLATRVGAVLDSRQRRGRAGAIPVTAACVAAAVLVLTMSPLRIVAAPQTAGAGTAATAMPTFVSSTMLVIEDVKVSDQTGKSLEGLKADDFAVTEDGKPQMVNVFQLFSLSDSAGPNLSYYVLGYYSTNSKMDGAYRNVRIALKNDATAKLDYRAGYYTNGFLSNSISLGRGGAGTGPGGVMNGLNPGATPPSVLMRTDPEYSEEARKAKYTGTVTLNVEVGADGQVGDVRVVRPLGMGLDEKAVAAVHRWKFMPGKKDGKPIAVTVQVLMNFRLI